ncbi:alpha/beta hydrolase [Cryobacterium sp. 1639]|uniref:alpha/beta fold hydrolase n=1 Tax=Cryobacterium inferilacus TaxID=2866629 RepID=UPI001C73654F|nr:alpha/beta hydrolase [Cryobacterium sp. 1639]MBX0300368.1 alpha/beta hydrolase [Cryobacterium sp. 1639]
MATVTSRDGTVIGFDQLGTGPALILVDGAGCYRDAGPLRSLAALLAPGFTVYTYDRRGRGASSDTLPFSVDREIDDVQALIGAAGGRAALFGMSSGGALAIAAAARLGPVITDLAVHEVPVSIELDPAALKYSRELADALAHDRRADAVALFFDRVGLQADQVASLRHTPAWASVEAIAPTLAYDDAVLGDGLLPYQRIEAVRVPVTVLSGEFAPEFIRESARAMATAFPLGRHVELAGQSHNVDLTVLATALSTVLRGAVPPGRPSTRGAEPSGRDAAQD